MKNIEEIKENIKTWEHKRLLGFTYCCLVKLPDCGTCSCVFSNNEDGFEHVSISPMKKNNMPSWDDMATLKDLFFYDEEEVYQIHPPKSEYVNIKDNCLHLWRPTNGRRINELVK